LLQQFSSSNINREHKLALDKDEPALNKELLNRTCCFLPFNVSNMDILLKTNSILI